MSRKKIKKWVFSTTVAVTSALFAANFNAVNAAAIAEIPDAGSIQSGVDQERDWSPKEQKSDVRVDTGKVEPAQDDIKLNVTEVRLNVDDKVVTPEELAGVLEGETTGEKSFSQLQAMADKLTNYLRKKGYMTAIALIPTQDIVNGVVTIQVLLGHYGDTVYENSSQLDTSRVDGFTYPSRKGKLIYSRSLGRQLLIMNDIPGVKAHADIYPGSEHGKADIKYKITTTDKQSGYLYADNYGNRFSGRWRIGGSWSYNNLSHVGDQLSLSYLQSFNHLLQNYDFRYELPVGNFGTFAGIELYRTDYELSGTYKYMGAYGISNGIRLYTRTSLKRTDYNNLFFLAELDHSKLVDRYSEFNTESKKTSNALRLGFEGDNRTAKSASTYKITHSIGTMSMDNDYAWTADKYGTNGRWQKTALDAYHIQNLQPRLDLHLRLRAQYHWSALDTSEHIYIGGYNAVRAFPMGEAGGDKGILGSAELRYQTGSPYWQVAAFWDGGWVQYNQPPVDQPKKNYRSTSLQGIGLGVIWRNAKSKSYARLDYAYPIGGSYSKSYERKIGGTWWFRFIQQF